MTKDVVMGFIYLPVIPEFRPNMFHVVEFTNGNHWFWIYFIVNNG